MVDSTPPETNKTFSGPFYTDGISEWIDTDSWIHLTAEEVAPVLTDQAVEKAAEAAPIAAEQVIETVAPFPKLEFIILIVIALIVISSAIYLLYRKYGGRRK